MSAVQWTQPRGNTSKIEENWSPVYRIGKKGIRKHARCGDSADMRYGGTSPTVYVKLNVRRGASASEP